MPNAADRDRALERLVAQHADRLFSIGYRLCGSRADAEDLVQETFLSAWKGWHAFRGDSDPGTWLYAIASRACRRRARRRSGEPPRHLRLEEVAPLPDRTRDGPEERAARSESSDRVRRAIARLPEPYRLPLVLKDIEELSLEETAEVLRLRLATVKTRLHRARLALRKEMLGEPPARRKLPPPECLRALEEALDAMDRGRPAGASHLCERCREVFRSLDAVRGACRALAGQSLAPRARARLRRLLRG